MKDGYKGFFMEESLRKAESSAVPTSHDATKLKKRAGEGVQGATAKPPAKQINFIRRGGEGSPRAESSTRNRKALGNKQEEPSSSEGNPKGFKGAMVKPP